MQMWLIVRREEARRQAELEAKRREQERLRKEEEERQRRVAELRRRQVALCGPYEAVTTQYLTEICMAFYLLVIEVSSAGAVAESSSPCITIAFFLFANCDDACLRADQQCLQRRWRDLRRWLASGVCGWRAKQPSAGGRQSAGPRSSANRNAARWKPWPMCMLASEQSLSSSTGHRTL